MQAEACGPRYDHLMMLEARRRSLEALRRVASRIAPGMTEENAVALMRDELRAGGMVRGWHAIKVRFGVNTLLTFRQPAQPGVVLGDDDVFFLDIGPVWRHWEADLGETFAVGGDPEMHRIAHDVKAVFDVVQARWQRDRLTGEALYRVAVEEAGERGWLLNLEMTGHRVSEFPHAAQYDGALIDQRFVPAPGLWILEIQIRHPTRPFGAFFEDLLLDAADA